MKFIRAFSDLRLGDRCVHCGAAPTTRDHVPPRALLDPPYPENLAVVPSCQPCNSRASADEQYLACALEAAVCGSAEPDRLERAKIARALERRPKLRTMIADAFVPNALAVDSERVGSVLGKTARGLRAYETSEHWPAGQLSVWFGAISTLDEDQRRAFLDIGGSDLCPEIGSRLMQRSLVDWGGANVWQVVQADRFEYSIETRRAGDRVKMLVRGYLAVEVTFFDDGW